MISPHISRVFNQIFTICLLMFVSFEQRFGRADEPHWMGKTSCAAATCHGGITGNGPAWNSSLSTWESTDRGHVNAGKLLENNQSKAIVARLIGRFGNIDSLSANELRKVLEDRCVSCHAPSKSTLASAGSERPVTETAWQEKIVEGVSCEACHGPASRWISDHTRKDFSATSIEATSIGMVANKLWLERTANCTKCHVGSRTTDGVVRDMNHDLIAAGHPALRFDMSRYQYYLAPHWQILRKGPESMARELPSLKQHHSARLRTLAAVAKLSLERLADARQNPEVPQPEFSDFDCYQCHQGIQFNSRFQPSHLAWNSFYTNQVRTNAQASLPVNEIRIRSTDNTPLVKIVELALKSSSQAMEQSESSAIQIIKLMQQLKPPQGAESDWLDVANWYWENRIAILNIAIDKQVSSAGTTSSLGKLSQLLGQFEAALAASPVAEMVPSNAMQGAKPIDILQLNELYRPYAQQLENVRQSMQKANSSGANQ